jgi:prolyl oligopeptidase
VIARPPDTAIEEVVETIHGVDVRDPYRWLEDGESERVREWARAQTAHARSVLDAVPQRDAIARRLEQAMDCGLLGLSVPRGERIFFALRTAGMNQPALYVREAGSERLLVDPNPLSADGTASLDWWTPSPDGELVCYGISEAGDEDSTLMLIETATGRLLPDRIPHCPWSTVAFEPGNGAILYSRKADPASVPEGEQFYHRHVWRHVLGSEPATDVEVFGQGREKTDFPIGASISAGGRWSVVTVARGYTRTAAFLSDGDAGFRPIFEGPDAELHPWFEGDRLVALTNLDAPNYRFVEIDPEHPEPGGWRELIPESEHVLVGAALSADGLFAHHLVDACSRVTRDGSEVTLPGFCTVTALGAHVSSRLVFLTVETFTRPAFLVEVGVAEREVFALQPPPAFDPDRFPVRQVRYQSADGTQVPMFLIGRLEGEGPVLLTGYGGFNISRTPLWAATWVPFLEAGGLVALPNLRGGGEYGERWHRAGMLGDKQNVFDDFTAAAEWLIAAGLTKPELLGIVGGSNGGLLVGVAMTQRPELYGAVVCRVPLLDMVRYERFRIAQLWAAEYGSADDPDGFSWLFAYSPYHHVEAGQRYPPTLLTAGEEDARVDPMHARKLAARMQAANPDGLTLLRVEPRAGHGQGKPVAKLVPEEADVWAFLFSQLAL